MITSVNETPTIYRKAELNIIYKTFTINTQFATNSMRVYITDDKNEIKKK